MSTPQTVSEVGFSAYVREIKHTADALSWIWKVLVGPEGKRFTLLMFVAFIVSALFGTLQPLMFSRAVNLVDDSKLQMLLLACGALASVALVHLISQVTQQLLRERAWNRNMLHLQSKVNELFYEKSLGQHSSEGSLLSHTTIDRAKGRVENVQMILFFDVGSSLVQLLFVYILLWTLGPLIGLIATLLILVHVSWSLYLNYHVSTKTESIEKQFRAHNRQLIERWEKISRVKTSGKSSAEHERLTLWFDEILRTDLSFWTWFITRSALRDALALSVNLGVIGYGVFLVYTDVWPVGSLIPLFAWMTTLYQNLGYIGLAERRLSQQVPFIKSMQRALELPVDFVEGAGKTLSHTTPISVRFEGVGLSYEDGTYPILEDIHFTINPGEKVALIGSSGAGKTSIMKLLLRYTDPSEGEIWVNGSRLTDIALPSWMERVGYIPQQSEVFDGTIRYNLTFGLPEERKNTITDEEIWDVMQLLQIDFGARLTDGLETRVGRNGLKLSGGQAQRLMIGAAVIKKPIFMVIDEATSSLDSTTERLVQKGLEAVLSGPVGALIVAHRLSTVRTMCNRFIVLRPHQGRGIPQIEADASSFEELYKGSETFRRLADDQGIVI
ncbi:MAG: ABC transporter ATP-binding protein [Candidatus Pacebacteria bacterium]|nr:ABC transporter ATP-binding protein [Candidatus Paceibacterota bacterium]